MHGGEHRRAGDDGRAAVEAGCVAALDEQGEVLDVERTSGIGRRWRMTAERHQRAQRHHEPHSRLLDRPPDGPGEFAGRRGALNAELLDREVDGIRFVVRLKVSVEDERYVHIRGVVVIVVVMTTVIVAVRMPLSVTGGLTGVDVGPQVVACRCAIAMHVPEHGRWTQQQARQQE
jgi:hypothetical protein